MKHTYKTLIGGLVLPIMVVGQALAHHGATVFDRKNSVQKTGKVTEFIYRNPHLIINMEVQDEDGHKALWKIEGQSIAALRKNGFDRDSIKEGDTITVKMRPLKNGDPGGLLQGLIGADGKAYSMDGSELTAQEDRRTGQRLAAPALVDYVAPPAGETWQMREKKTRPASLPIISNGQAPGDDSYMGTRAGALDPDNLAKQRPASFDLTGVWQFRGEDSFRANYGSYEFKPLPKLTPSAHKYYQEYLDIAKSGGRYEDPAIQCYPVGMPRVMTRYGAMMMMQYPTAIYMVSRLSNEFRTIYLDGRERLPESTLERNWGGESIGHWEGDTLVVETKGFIGEHHFIQAGIKAGKQLTIVERYKLINDGNTLMMEFTMTDPENWEGEWKQVKFRDRVLRADVKEANCIYADNMALPGH